MATKAMLTGRTWNLNQLGQSQQAEHGIDGNDDNLFMWNKQETASTTNFICDDIALGSYCEMFLRHFD